MSTAQFRQWAEALQETIQGQIMLANLKHDLESGRLDNETKKDVKQDLLIHLGNRTQSHGQALRVFEQFARGKECRGLPIIANTEPLSRVVSVVDFLSYNIEPTRMPSQLISARWQVQLEYMERRGIPAAAAVGYMETGRPMAWVTKSSEIDAIIRDHTAGELVQGLAASRIRNALGLVSLQFAWLVEIKYPAKLASTCAIVPPLVLDGGATMVYRSCNDGDGWGRTVDLETCEAGLPEAVHAKLPFTGEFEVRNLYRTLASCPTVVWGRILAKCTHHWQPGDEVLL